jgi:hypothetical protein
MTYLEVIDSAIKIGLGGLITLIGTIFVTKTNHKHDNDKENAKRYYDALELVGSNIEEITHVTLRYWAIVIEWVRNDKLGLSLSEKRQAELERTKSDLFDQFKNLTVAESKLLLLDLTEQSKLLREYGEFITELRRKYYDGKENITEDDMKKVRLDLLQKRERLFKSLSVAYTKSEK